jgi:hypothetical protein
MITALPDHSRSVGDTTPGVPLTGAGAREGKRANLLLARPGHRSQHGSPGPRGQPFGGQFCSDADADG